MTVLQEITEIRQRLGTIANMYALGQGGLPKNGTTAVALHTAASSIGNAIRALEDADYCREEGINQVMEHLMEGPLGMDSKVAARGMALELFPNGRSGKKK